MRGSSRLFLQPDFPNRVNVFHVYHVYLLPVTLRGNHFSALCRFRNQDVLLLANVAIAVYIPHPGRVFEE